MTPDNAKYDCSGEAAMTKRSSNPDRSPVPLDLALIAPRARSGSRQAAALANSRATGRMSGLGNGNMTLFHCDVRFVHPIYDEKRDVWGGLNETQDISRRDHWGRCHWAELKRRRSTAA